MLASECLILNNKYTFRTILGRARTEGNFYIGGCMSKMREQIVGALRDRGGTIIHARGHQGFQHLAGAMKLCPNWTDNARELHALVRECRELESEGVLEILWAGTTKDNRPRCSLIRLVEAMPVEDEQEEDLPDDPHVLQELVKYLLTQQEGSEALIDQLRRDAVKRERALETAEASLAESQQRVLQLSGDTAELQRQLDEIRRAETVAVTEELDVTAADTSGLSQATAQRVQQLLTALDARVEELETELSASIAAKKDVEQQLRSKSRKLDEVEALLEARLLDAAMVADANRLMAAVTDVEARSVPGPLLNRAQRRYAQRVGDI